MSVVPVKNANRMMAPASLLDNGIELSFADGARGLIPYADVPEVKVRAGISGLERPDPYEMALQTAEGERVEVSWAFARHYCGALYRPTAEAMAAMGRQALGGRVRRFRGLTQVELARAAGIGRVTLVRLENGEQNPRFRTLTALARALGTDVPELLVEPEPLLRQPPASQA